MSWKDIVGAVAPTIATALGGPMAGAAVKALGGALLGDENASENAVAKAIKSADPEVLQRVRAADQEFELKMEELGVDLEEIAAKDRASARDLQKSTGSIIVPILAGITVAGFFGVVAWVLTGNVGLDSTLLGFVLGQVSAKAEQVYNFFFGSSAGSKEKTQKLKGSDK
jgi:hypothetical protein